MTFLCPRVPHIAWVSNRLGWVEVSRNPTCLSAVIMTLPQGGYRFRADKNGEQYWSGEVNHCAVPGCAGAAITTTIPVVVTVEDGAGDPEPDLPVYAFDDTTYSGYHGTTDVSGTVTLTLLAGDYRFRSDKNGTQYWSGTSNHCTVPGCTEATITVSSQAMKIPAEGLAFTLDGIPAFADVETLFDPPDADENQTAYRPPGLAALPLVPSDSPTIQSGETVTITRVITQVYDPLSRLTEATYSTGESFAYQYDAAGNRTAYTATTPLSGTVVTTYTFDAANRLTDRAVSDGRVYTYTWSARGQMLAEYTQGYPVRTFTYDGAGQLVEATVFTLTTRFTYNGLGDRVAVEVVGQGVTTYTLDLAAGGHILDLPPARRARLGAAGGGRRGVGGEQPRVDAAWRGACPGRSRRGGRGAGGAGIHGGVVRRGCGAGVPASEMV